MEMRGKKVVVAGRLKVRDRQVLVEGIEAIGGSLASRVSRTTDLVVTGDSPGAKVLARAGELGIAVITIADALRAISGEQGNANTRLEGLRAALSKQHPGSRWDAVCAELDGWPEDAYGTACRNPDGSWRIAQ